MYIEQAQKQPLATGQICFNKDCDQEQSQTHHYQYRSQAIYLSSLACLCHRRSQPAVYSPRFHPLPSKYTGDSLSCQRLQRRHGPRPVSGYLAGVICTRHPWNICPEQRLLTHDNCRPSGLTSHNYRYHLLSICTPCQSTGSSSAN